MAPPTWAVPGLLSLGKNSVSLSEKVSMKFVFQSGQKGLRNHGTLAKIMASLAKSWLTMVPLSRSWQDHGKILTRETCLS